MNRAAPHASARVSAETGRRHTVAAAIVLFAAIAGSGTIAVAAAGAPLVIDEIVVSGNSRTPRETIDRFLPLRAGDAVSPDSVIAAIDVLRSSGLFESVDVTSRRSVERGHVVVDVVVVEMGVGLLFGAGYQDLSGWYLIPAALRLDNQLGRGERTRLALELGHRHAGVRFSFDEPRLGDGLSFWGFGLSAATDDRVFFLDGVEYRIPVGRAGVDVHIGRRLATRLRSEIGAAYEAVDSDSIATANSDDATRGVERGDDLDPGDLPEGIARATGDEQRTTIRADLVWDSRGQDALPGAPSSGAWGCARVQHTFQDGEGFALVTGDLRAYRAIGGSATAARVRAGAIGEGAPFYDRFYVGGIYTVRGFPSQSLSRPEGDTRFATASIELRAPLVGRGERTRLSGILFADAGLSFSDDAAALDDISAGAGYGLRLRVPWLGQLGLDVGIPLTDSPVEEKFHAYGSIGWTY